MSKSVNIYRNPSTTITGSILRSPEIFPVAMGLLAKTDAAKHTCKEKGKEVGF